MKKSRPKRLWFAVGGFLAVAATVGTPQQAFAAPEPQSTAADQAVVTVKGTVFDENDEPVIGASVVVKGTKDAVTTYIDGNFTIRCKKNAILAISYVGYNTSEVAASSNLKHIVLAPKSEVLDDVVVIGYGTTTRRAAVGAVDQVKGEKIAERPVLNMTQAMQGAAPNVIIQSNSYDPNNQSTTFNIRGVTSTTSSSPLFVIDGVVADDGAFNRLNPNDVENISVLKDAGAAAIYGSRSAAGVILVTTKSGKKDTPATVTFSANVGWEDPYYPFDTVDGYQNAWLYNQALINSGMEPKFSPAEIQDLYNHRAEEVWSVDEISKTALQQKYNVMVQGGSKNTTYMFSLGYYNQASNLVGKNNQGIQRYNMRMNIGTDIGRFHIGAIMQFTRNNSMTSSAYLFNVYADSRRTPKYYYYNTTMKDGLYVHNSIGGSPVGALNTPGYNKYRNNDWSGTLNADFKIMDGLKLRGVFGANINNQTRSSRSIPTEHYSESLELQTVSPKDYSASNWNADSYRLNSQILLDFNRTFADVHTVNAMIGFTNESYTAFYNEVSQGYIDSDLGIPSEDTTTENDAFGGSTYLQNRGRTSINSLIGRAGYNYADRYMAEFTFRYDGSSKFHKDHRWGFFPSVSLGWRATEESFLKRYQQNVGDLKLRLSYGVLGNQAVGDFDRFTTYQLYSGGLVFNNEAAGWAGFNSGQDDLTWEKTKTYNIGIDATFFKNALQFSIDAFYKRTTDILQTPRYPGIFGTSVPRANIGEMSNRGWELSIQYYLTTGDFHHSFNLNLGDTQNKLLKYPGHEVISGMDGLSSLRREGLALMSYYGLQTDGLFQSYEEIESSATVPGLTVHPGDVKYVDQNGDGVIDNNDRVVLGNPFPRYTFGFNYGLTWKGLDFSMFWQGVGKRSQYVRGEMLEPFHANYSWIIYKHQLDFWTPTNTDAEYPRLTASGTSSYQNNYKGSSLNVHNGAYARLKNLTVGYSLPNNIIRTLGMSKCRFYVTGENLWTICKKSWIDPEVSNVSSTGGEGDTSAGRYYRSYPSLRYYGLGIDITF